jgi:hypothetical protein
VSTDDIRSEVVRSLYRTVLRRDGDTGGVAHHAAYLAEGQGFSRLDSLINGFLASPEFKSRLVSSEFDPLRAAIEQGRDTGGNPYTAVMSLGPACYTSALLNRWGLRKVAGPFDWLLSSTVMVDHVLRDDFVTFLDRDQMRHVEIAPGDVRTDHAVYGRMAKYPPNLAASGVVFLHHDPLGDKDFDHFQRCVGRMRTALDGRALLLHFADMDEADAVAVLGETITTLSPQSRLLTVIVDEADDSRLLPEVVLWWRRGQHETYLMRPVSARTDAGFTNFLDEVSVARLIVRNHIVLPASGSID